jgi:uncharacterized protein YecT (DUF1311 family)
MPTDDPKGDVTPGPFVGFQTYADDSPRDFDARAEDAWRQPEQRSWEVPPPRGPAISEETYAEPPRRAVWPRLAVGAAVLAAFGGGFLLARSDPPATAPRPTSEAAAMAAARPMNVEVAAATPAAPPAVSNGAKLEVLPRSMGPAASFTPRPLPSPAREAPRLAIAPAAPTPTIPAPAAPAPAPREVAEAPVPRDAVAVAPAPAPLRTTFDCRNAPTRARAMVCRDAGLAAMDRRMKEAYAAAVAAGAPREELAADQEDWLGVREDAASYSRRAVADIYRQRIDELDAMAGRR